MRSLFTSFFRLIACILVITVLTSGIAMAAYVCPELVDTPMSDTMEGMPCAGMDKERPVHCAEYQAGNDQALEHLAAAPTLTPPTISFVIPAVSPGVPPVITSFWPAVPRDPGNHPPYLRTQRLRI